MNDARRFIPVLWLLLLHMAGCQGKPAAEGHGQTATVDAPSQSAKAKRNSLMSENKPNPTEVATFGAGCFWCVEAVLERIDGVLAVSSGYMGGHVENPTYEQVCSGETGHAEVVQVEFDPNRTSYDRLLDVFWKLHDPTTLNRQGNDVGTQYRSIVFFHAEAQKKAAEAAKATMNASGAFRDPIVTEITQAGTFYTAEAHHQDYYRANKDRPYCRFVIVPKLNKLGLED